MHLHTIRCQDQTELVRPAVSVTTEQTSEAEFLRMGKLQKVGRAVNWYRPMPGGVHTFVIPLEPAQVHWLDPSSLKLEVADGSISGRQD